MAYYIQYQANQVSALCLVKWICSHAHVKRWGRSYSAVSVWFVLKFYMTAFCVIIWSSWYIFIISVSYHCKYLLPWISPVKTTAVEVSASSWSLFQGSLTKFGVSACDLEASLMRASWPTRGCCSMGKKRTMLEAFESGNAHSMINKLFSVTEFEHLAQTSVNRFCFGSYYGPGVDSASNREEYQT